MKQPNHIQQDYATLWRTIDALTNLINQVDDPDLKKYLERKRTLLYLRIQEYEHTAKPTAASTPSRRHSSRHSSRRI